MHPLHAEHGARRGWGEQEEPAAEEEEDGATGNTWLRVRPYGLPTERDKVCEAKWRPVYRVLLVRQ